MATAIALGQKFILGILYGIKRVYRAETEKRLEAAEGEDEAYLGKR